MKAILVDAARNHRLFEVTTPGGTSSVEYKANLWCVGTANVRHVERVSVNGEVVAEHQRPLAFVLRFRFSIGPYPALLEVRVWPWLSLRPVHLWVENQLLYAEGKGLLQSPENPDEQELLEKGRKVAVTLFSSGTVVAGVDLLMFQGFGGFFRVGLVLAPYCLLMGIAGLIDARICVLGEAARGRSLPPWTRAIQIMIAVIGLAIGLCLAVF
jgi:hypothetical protein